MFAGKNYMFMFLIIQKNVGDFFQRYK